MSHNWNAAVSLERVVPSNICDLLVMLCIKPVIGGIMVAYRRSASNDSSCSMDLFMYVVVDLPSCLRVTTEGRATGWLTFRKYIR